VERRLAAVLAADVAGYSRLMGADEEGTLARLKAVRKTLVDPAIASHRGRIVKTTGDGMLIEFASAVDAMRSAVEVQRRMAEQNAAVPQDQRIEFRIGIHVGDIIFDDNDIFGDGVNIAARLEGIADPGGVCISDDAHRQIRGKVDIIFENMGAQKLKNIAEPMPAWRMQIGSSPALALTKDVFAGSGYLLPLPDKPSIAVLPFQNMSGDPEQEYFADGMVEDIITALSKFKSLFVIARNSSFTYKGKSVDIKQVGRELGVRYLLEGSVRKAGNKVRITGQLIDATNGSHLWADRFDGALDDIFDLQDRVTSSVVGAIFPKLQLSEFERAKQKPTDNLTAYDYHLRGFSKMYLFKKEALEEALPLFHKAIESDPEFASPYAAAAFWYVVRQTFGWNTNRDQDAIDSVALARRALELENDDAIVLTFAGFVLGFWSHNTAGGAELLERATHANPNLALAWNYLGWVNTYLGNHSSAVEYFKKALRLSPLDPLMFTTQTGLGYAYFFMGQEADALKWAEITIGASPGFLPAHRLVTVCHAVAGRTEAAKTVWEFLRQKDPAQRISSLMHRLPFQREEDRTRLSECYRLAGVPE
jgi:TolB-like protein/class 3 adenylate cyclase